MDLEVSVSCFLLKTKVAHMIRTATALLLLALIPAVVKAYEFVGDINGEQSGDQFGTAITTVDFNADGYPDMVISAPAADVAGVSSGTVYIYYGGPAADTVADLKLVGVASSFFGNSLASAGDFNNDTYEDLLVGAPFYDSPATSAGAVFLYYGSPSPDTTVDHIFEGESESDYFGTSVAGIGDFNNDTFDDIAIGAYRADWGLFTNAGKVYIYYGGNSPDFVADRQLVGDADGERFGFDVVGGDFNGDSNSDVAVGAYSYDAALLNVGRIYLFYGGSSPDTLADLRITGDSAGNKFGWSLSTGRINDDLFDDIFMGTDGFTVSGFAAGHVYLFHGGPGIDVAADFSYTLGQASDDFLGYDVASGVDVNEDGFDDMLAGMPGYDGSGSDMGGMITFSGGAAVQVDTTIGGSSTAEELGEAVGQWSWYGSAHTYVIAAGATAYSSFTGRVHLYQNVIDAPNSAPVLDPIGPKSVRALDLLAFVVSASDPDGTIPMLEVSASSLPSGASFTDSLDGTGGFEWTPALADTGIHEVWFIANDGELADSELVAITVNDTTSCCNGDDKRGNVDGQLGPGGEIDVADLAYLVDFLFRSGPPPPCADEGNIDGQSGPGGTIDVADLSYLVDFLFRGGPPPAVCP